MWEQTDCPPCLPVAGVDSGGQVLGFAGYLLFMGGEIGADAVDVEGDDGGLAFFGEEEGAVGTRVHEEVFGFFYLRMRTTQ